MCRSQTGICGPRPAVQTRAGGQGQYRQIRAEVQLFDIQEDPYEEKDSPAEKPETVKEMLVEYDAWFEEISRHGSSKAHEFISAAPRKK